MLSEDRQRGVSQRGGLGGPGLPCSRPRSKTANVQITKRPKRGVPALGFFGPFGFQAANRAWAKKGRRHGGMKGRVTAAGSGVREGILARAGHLIPIMNLFCALPPDERGRRCEDQTAILRVPSPVSRALMVRGDDQPRVSSRLAGTSPGATHTSPAPRALNSGGSIAGTG